MPVKKRDVPYVQGFLRCLWRSFIEGGAKRPYLRSSIGDTRFNKKQNKSMYWFYYIQCYSTRTISLECVCKRFGSIWYVAIFVVIVTVCPCIPLPTNGLFVKYFRRIEVLLHKSNEVVLWVSWVHFSINRFLQTTNSFNEANSPCPVVSFRAADVTNTVRLQFSKILINSSMVNLMFFTSSRGLYLFLYGSKYSRRVSFLNPRPSHGLQWHYLRFVDFFMNLLQRRRNGPQWFIFVLNNVSVVALP